MMRKKKQFSLHFILISSNGISGTSKLRTMDAYCSKHHCVHTASDMYHSDDPIQNVS